MKRPISVITVFIICFSFLLPTLTWGQGGGSLTGDFQMNAKFFVRDSAIGAANTPQYDRQKFGAESWMALNYQNWGFDIGLRFDAFLNSNLIDPQDSYSALGIGRWHIRKSFLIDKKKNHTFDITAGYIYDQIGSGVLFQSYEARPLAIDNALVGGRLIYKFGDYITVKGFAGRQKKVEKQENLFETYKPVIAGAAVEGFVDISDSTGKGVQLVPGIGVVRRTLDDETMGVIVSDIVTYAPQDTFTPRYNTYAFSVYNTLTAGRFSWFAEAAFKTAEAVNANNPKGVLENQNGYNLFTSLTYSQKGFAVTAQYKRTDHFIMRTSPLQTLNRGQIGFLPPMARQNTYRLPARYNAATQEIGEQAVQLDILYAPIKTKDHKLSFLFNFSNIFSLDSVRTSSSFSLDENLLYREFYFETTYKFKRKWKLIAGFQFQQYNQEIYEIKPGVPIVTTYIPFTEFSYRFDKKKSLRIEAQYMSTEQDFGSWLWFLAEFNIAPRWSFTLSDMINVVPKKYSRVEHFYTAGVTYKKGSTRFMLSYIKQVEGIVCTGGICRYEPAFNGVRFDVNSRF
ncbi:MAG: DUF6029 family protein [Saprospiraceae bacterium]|nr:DUF6029 family protein [Saprospiraceae bacterium]